MRDMRDITDIQFSAYFSSLRDPNGTRLPLLSQFNLLSTSCLNFTSLR